MHFPFYTLPFDHRNALAKDILNVPYPFSEADTVRARELKRIVFEAILQARDNYSGKGCLGALFDEETALEIILEAQKVGLPVTVSVEKSGTSTLELIHGADFSTRLEALRPTFAKLLVHYQADNEDKNMAQRQLIKQVSDFCEPAGVPLMLEILLDKPSQPTAADIIPVFQELQAEGIKVGLWKIEGLATAKEWQAVAPYAQAPMIILGRGQATEAVEKWIQAAAESGVVDGFAIGRTIFEAPLKSFVAGQSTRVETVTAIATDYLRFIHIWETYV